MTYFLLRFQISQGTSRYCKVAVNTAISVRSCPTSKKEWEIAAQKKNCSKIASQQTCSSAEKFQYHCVLNGYRNETVEVCAPSRMIFGHCVEFNRLGGIIQDQRSSHCNKTFPKCDEIYISTEAYKYPDCYQLVSMSGILYSTTTMKYAETSTTTDESFSGIVVGIAGVLSFVLLSSVCLFVSIRIDRCRIKKEASFLFKYPNIKE